MTEVDLRVSYAGAMTVQTQDGIRAHTLPELLDRVGPVQLILVFTTHAIDEAPAWATPS